METLVDLVSRMLTSNAATPCSYCDSDNPALRATYFDQSCPGCVKRMGEQSQMSGISTKGEKQ